MTEQEFQQNEIYRFIFPNEVSMKLKSIYPILDKFYKENWTLDNNYNIIIRYPEINITNSRNDYHIIYDLFIKIKINDNIIQRIEGKRLSFTQNELNNKYSHSHLSISDFPNWCKFCLGESEINMIIGNINSDFFNSPIELWESFFLMIDKYLEWESIEGVPYRYINKIGTGTLYNEPFSDSYSRELLLLVLPYLKDYVEINNELILNKNIFRHSVLDSLRSSEYFCKYNYDCSNYVNLNDSNLPNINIYFRNNNYISQLINIDSNNISNILPIPNAKIVNNIETIINEKFNKFKSDYSISRYQSAIISI